MARKPEPGWHLPTRNKQRPQLSEPPSEPPSYQLSVPASRGDDDESSAAERLSSPSPSLNVPRKERTPDDLPPISPGKRDLWAQAAEALDPRTLAKWQETTLPKAPSVQEILDSAKERARSQQSKVWKERWRSLIKSITTVKSLVDAGLKFDPTGYGALAWSILSFGLDAAAKHAAISDELAESCDYIRGIIDEYSMYEARYLSIDSQGRAPLEQSIVEVYKGVITYAAELKYYIHHKLDRLGKALQGTSTDSSFTAFKASIEEKRADSRNLIDDVRSEFSESELKAIQDKIQEMLDNYISKLVQYVDDQQRETVLNWVSLTTPSSVHTSQRDKAQAALDALDEDRRDPGVWIFDHSEYLNWKSGSKTSSLWLVSGVGTGKTTLASTVIEGHLENSPGPLAYFYCSGASGSTGTEATAEEILKSILRQFATSSEIGLALVRSQWEKLHQQRSLTRIEVIELFRDIIESEETLEATIIIDGLDEMNFESLKSLLGSLSSLLAAERGILKVFASSRWVQRIEDVFFKGHRIENIAGHTSSDMISYIDSTLRVETMNRRDIGVDLIDKIKDTLLARANGMFRYVEMSLKYIFDGPTTKAIEKRLKSLPLPASGDAVLRPMYEKLYEAIEDEDAVNRLLAHRVVHWLLHQLFPISADALLQAVCFGIDGDEDGATATELEELSPGIDEVKAACHHLVIYNQTTRRFEFGHISVVEFIKWKDTPMFSDFAAQSTLAAACLVFLTGGEQVEPEAEQPLLKFGTYAVLCWANHWQAIDHRNCSSALQALFDRFWNTEKHLENCLESLDVDSLGLLTYNHDHIGSLLEDGKLDLMAEKWAIIISIVRNHSLESSKRWLLACSYDFSVAAIALVNSGRIEAELGLFVCGIKLALAFGSIDLVEVMLSKHINAAKLHSSGTSLLHHAANLQNPRSVNACLKWFPDQINLHASGALDVEWISTPLLMALRSGNLGGFGGRGALEREESNYDAQTELFTSILDAPNVDISVSDKKGRNALILAVHLKAEPIIISRLLKGPADIFRRDIDGETVLIVGEKLDTRQDLRYLLDILWDNMHPLQIAAREGDSDRVQQILAEEQYDMEDTNPRDIVLSALFLAVEHANMECVRLLMKSPGQDINIQDQDGFSALMVAAISGKEYPVTKLRLQGANVALEMSTGRNALFFAIRKKKSAALRALTLPMTCSPFDINHQDSVTGRTALHYVCEYTAPTEMDWALPSSRDMVDILLERGADLAIRDNGGKLPRDVAAENGYQDLVEMLSPAGDDTFGEPKTEVIKPPDMSEVVDIDAIDVGSWYSFESFRSLCYTLAHN